MQIKEMMKIYYTRASVPTVKLNTFEEKTRFLSKEKINNCDLRSSRILK